MKIITKVCLVFVLLLFANTQNNLSAMQQNNKDCVVINIGLPEGTGQCLYCWKSHVFGEMLNDVLCICFECLKTKKDLCISSDTFDGDFEMRDLEKRGYCSAIMECFRLCCLQGLPPCLDSIRKLLWGNKHRHHRKIKRS